MASFFLSKLFFLIYVHIRGAFKKKGVGGGGHIVLMIYFSNLSPSGTEVDQNGFNVMKK